MPKRIQRKRAKGWKMPEGAVYVGRPSRFGNPFRIEACRTPAKTVRVYRAWLTGKGFNPKGLTKIIGGDVTCAWEGNGLAFLQHAIWASGIRELAKKELRGKDLACWCPLDQPCHADILLEIANQ